MRKVCPSTFASNRQSTSTKQSTRYAKTGTSHMTTGNWYVCVRTYTGKHRRRNRMGRVQHTGTERQRGDVLRGMVRRPRDSLQGTSQGTSQGRQGTQTKGVGRVGRLKVCEVGRYAYIRPTCICDLALHKAAPHGSRLLAYNYDLLVASLDRHTRMSRCDIIDWLQKHVIPLAEGPSPRLKIIYK